LMNLLCAGGSCNVNNIDNMNPNTYKTKTNMTAVERLLFSVQVLALSQGTPLDLFGILCVSAAGTLGTLNLVLKTQKPTRKKLQAQP